MNKQEQSNELYPVLATVSCPIRPLDFVRPKSKPNAVGMVTEIGSFKNTEDGITYQASVEWIGGGDGLHTAWWQVQQLDIVDNLARLLSRELAHPFGNGNDYLDRSYPNCG
jgi:hypothetical protein